MREINIVYRLPGCVAECHILYGITKAHNGHPLTLEICCLEIARNCSMPNTILIKANVFCSTGKLSYLSFNDEGDLPSRDTWAHQGPLPPGVMYTGKTIKHH